MQACKGPARGIRSDLIGLGALIVLLILSGCVSIELDDTDHDGYSPAEGDCDDSAGEIYPGSEAVGVDGGCGGPGEVFSGEEEGLDQDGDGVTVLEGDCDDGNPAIYPGAEEIRDREDNDCDHAVDEGLGMPPAPTEDDATPMVEMDRDGDGFTESEGDCDDSDPTVHPGAEEQDDPVDHDCDGQAYPVATSQTPLPLVDEDGDGVSLEQGDCDDSDPRTYPGADEVADGVDNDCDGVVDEVSDTLREDEDGDGVAVEQGDCDDSDPTTYPGADEVLDGVDNDCDGFIDGTAVVVGDETVDDDQDGYSEVEGDCDDSDPLVYPNAVSIPGTPQADCSGAQAATGDTSRDHDGDGFSVLAGDCNDNNDTVHPEAPEQCNGNDDDCDGEVDEELPTGTYYYDQDGDGYGVASATQVTCSAAPTGFAVRAGDCNDLDPEVHPGAVELCNGLDDDCDQKVDGSDAEDAVTWYADADGDGYGDPEVSVRTCYAPPGYVENDLDCDDTSDATYPGAEERNDRQDNDCDGEVDE